MKSEIYYTVLEPGPENNQAWYSGAMRIMTEEKDEIRTYHISPNSTKETVDLLIMIEALEKNRDVNIRTDRKEITENMKWNTKKWEKEDFIQKEDREAWRAIAYHLQLNEERVRMRKIETETEVEIIKELIEVMKANE